MPAATVSAVTDHVSGPDDGHEPNAIRRNVGYVVTGWRILQLRRRARRETRLVWYGRWRNYMLPGLAAVAVGVTLSMLVGVTTGTAGSRLTHPAPSGMTCDNSENRSQRGRSTPLVSL